MQSATSLPLIPYVFAGWLLTQTVTRLAYRRASRAYGPR
jgi:hypothetical protein